MIEAEDVVSLSIGRYLHDKVKSVGGKLGKEFGIEFRSYDVAYMDGCRTGRICCFNSADKISYDGITCEYEHVHTWAGYTRSASVHISGQYFISDQRVSFVLYGNKPKNYNLCLSDLNLCEFIDGFVLDLVKQHIARYCPARKDSVIWL